MKETYQYKLHHLYYNFYHMVFQYNIKKVGVTIICFSYFTSNNFNYNIYKSFIFNDDAIIFFIIIFKCFGQLE